MGEPWTTHFAVIEFSEGGYKEWQRLDETFDQFVARIRDDVATPLNLCWVTGWYRADISKLEQPDDARPRCPHAHPVRNLRSEVVACPACGGMETPSDTRTSEESD